MGVIGGKTITVFRSHRRGRKDFVVREDVRRKKFLMFLTHDTARQIMIVGEDLLMRPNMRRNKWSFEEADRWVDLEVIQNRFDRSLVIKSESKDSKRWRSRVYIPEGQYGEGWLSLSRQIKTLLQEARDDNPLPPQPPPPPPFSSPSLPSLPSPLPASLPPTPPLLDWLKIQKGVASNRFGCWEHMVVCHVSKDQVDWNETGLKLAEAFFADGDFELFPFDDQSAIIVATTQEEQDLLCNGNHLLDEESKISLNPWNPSNNKIARSSQSCSWVGITGLPFHLWSPGLFADIANLFGTLQAVDENTTFHNDLRMARIKVQGNLAKMPMRVDVEEGEELHHIGLILMLENIHISPRPLMVV